MVNDDLVDDSVNEPNKFENLKKIIHNAESKLNAGQLEEAFQLLIEAKSYKIPFKNLDLLRATYFLKLNQFVEARECVDEELAHFPNNETAINLRLQFNTPTPRKSSIEDDEFNTVLNKIRRYTMLSTERLYSLWTLSKKVCESNVPGNFVECGVARGGSSALLAYVIKNYSKIPRQLFSFDTFEGMPEPTEDDKQAGIAANETGWGTGTCSAPKDSLIKICEELGVLDFVNPVQGLFQETLPVTNNKIKQIAFLHMDGDWYESTKCILENLYDQVPVNGLIQIDDFGWWDGCRKAITEFQHKNNLNFQMHKIDVSGVWFLKTDNISESNATL